MSATQVNLPSSSTTTIAERLEVDGEERVNYQWLILVPSALFTFVIREWLEHERN